MAAPSALPASAPALRFAAFGGPEVLATGMLPVPLPAEGEALVAVHAASINPSDVKNVAGRMRQTVPPRTPGRDFAGVVVAGPAGWAGSEVWGTGGDIGFTRDGSHAAFLCVPAAALSRKPTNLSFEQAGAVGVNYVTALIGLDYAVLREGETLLVIGATGGVGGAACAIAAGRGARVIAASRGAAAREGAAASLDTEAPGFRDAVLAATDGRGPDVVYDCVGRPDLTEAAIEAVGFRGRVVVIAGTPAEKVRLELIPFYRREARLIGVDSLKRGAADCAPLMDALRPGFESGAYPAPIIAQAFPLVAARDAYATVAAGSRGRIVLSMR